jgi:hypothetical protein
MGKCVYTLLVTDALAGSSTAARTLPPCAGQQFSQHIRPLNRCTGAHREHAGHSHLAATTTQPDGHRSGSRFPLNPRPFVACVAMRSLSLTAFLSKTPRAVSPCMPISILPLTRTSVLTLTVFDLKEQGRAFLDRAPNSYPIFTPIGEQETTSQRPALASNSTAAPIPSSVMVAALPFRTLGGVLIVCLNCTVEMIFSTAPSLPVS